MSLLAISERNGRPESWHHGHLAVVAPDGAVLLARGEPETPIYVRSSVKPIQALPLWLSGAAMRFGLAPASLAVAMASHSGEDVHRAAVQALLDAAGLDAGMLGCGTHEPYDAPTAAALRAAGRPPDVLHCNCSGKHAGMLATCVAMGWDLASYRAPDHPLQRWIRDLLGELAQVAPTAIGHGVDGCGAPVWHLPVLGLARAYARLGSPAGLRPELAAAADAAVRTFVAHPALIAGSGRMDTDMVRVGGVVAKIGGEAVHAGVVPGGLAWAVKVGDGNKRALGPVLARALGLDWLADPALAPHLRPEVRNNHGTVLGHVVAGW